MNWNRPVHLQLFMFMFVPNCSCSCSWSCSYLIIACRYMFMFISIPAEFTGSLAMSMWTTWLVYFVDCVNILFFYCFNWLSGWNIWFPWYDFLWFAVCYNFPPPRASSTSSPPTRAHSLCPLGRQGGTSRLWYKSCPETSRLKRTLMMMSMLPSCNPDLRERSYNTDKHSKPPREPAERCQLGTLLWSSRW